MAENAEVRLFDRFMRLSRDAFDAGSFQAAYHALAGALHCAESLRDAKRLGMVQEETSRQIAIIDTDHPQHRVGSAAAARRGNTGVYRSLLAQLRAATAIANSPQHGTQQTDSV